MKRGEDGAELTRVLGTTDAAGRVRMFPLFEGDWELRVASIEATWSYQHPSNVSLDPGEEARVSIDVIVSSGRVRILDVADGTPLTERHIWVMSAVGGRSHTTNAEGWLELELTPGSYELRDAGENEGWNPGVEAASLDWTAAGPARDEVRLTRVEEDGP